MSSCLAARLLRPSASVRQCIIRSFSTQQSTQKTPQRKSRHDQHLFRHLKAPILENPKLPEHRITVTADALKAHYVNGQWKRAEVSAMALARERKVAQIRGEQFEFKRREPVRKTKPVLMKGHKHERTATSRAARVELAMKDMPARVEAYYKQLHLRRKEDSQALRLLGAAALNNLAGKGKQSKKSKKKQPAQ